MEQSFCPLQETEVGLMWDWQVVVDSIIRPHVGITQVLIIYYSIRLMFKCLRVLVLMLILYAWCVLSIKEGNA